MVMLSPPAPAPAQPGFKLLKVFRDLEGARVRSPILPSPRTLGPFPSVAPATYKDGSLGDEPWIPIYPAGFSGPRGQGLFLVSILFTPISLAPGTVPCPEEMLKGYT